MKLEILGKLVIITSRKKKDGTNCIKYLHQNTIKNISKQVLSGLTEGAIQERYKNVIGWWKISNISKNPLLK